MPERIKFRCPKCQADFGVDAKFAGRPCRCKHCGQQFRVPKVATAPKPQPVATGVGAAQEIAARAAQREQNPGEVPRPMSWIDAVTSQIALKPVTEDKLKPISGRAAMYMDDEDDSPGPYELASYPSLPLNRPPRKGVGKRVKQTYSNELRILQKILRKINERALELTVPFFILMPLGFIIKNHWLSIFGLTMVLLLNVGRFGVGLANVIVIPFRDSPMTGMTFWIPPWTFVKNNWHKFRKPVQRIISPICFLVGTFLLYSLVPWFQYPDGKNDVKMVRDPMGNLIPAPEDQQPPPPTIKERLTEGAQNLKKDIRGQVDDAKEQLPGAKKKLEQVTRDAVETTQEVKDQVQGAVEDFQQKRGTEEDSSE
ncbi:MAG: hypothetical protein KDA68_00605 [Planctomycetaceae bacterium]|nr:hypothetical protein [Planctomycetaceae bacterium]